MPKHTTGPRYGAIAGVVICAGATFKLMFSDVNLWSPSTITNEQTASFAALAVAILAGHYCWPELKALRATGLSLLVLALASTWYVVTTSAARTTEGRADVAASIHKANDIRVAAKTRVDMAESDIETAKAELRLAKAGYKDAQDKLTTECATGLGKACNGRVKAAAEANRAVEAATEAVKTANNHYEDVQSKFSKLPAPRVENAGYKATADAIASLPFVSVKPEVLAGRLAIQIPYLLAIICELGTIVFSNMAFRPREPAKGAADTTAPAAGKQRLEAAVSDAVVVALQRAKRDGRLTVTNDELADLVGVSKDVASKRVRALVAAGRVRRVRDGRQVAISLASDRLH